MRPVLKCLLILDGLVITVLGIGLTLLGVVVKFYTEMVNGYLTPLVKVLPAGGGTGSDVWTLYNMNSIAIIAMGIAVSISGFLGCLVATCPKQKITTVYMVLTAVLILGQLTSAALVLTMKIGDGMKDTMKIILVENYCGDEATDAMSAAWNYAFVEFGCCGAESYTDFKLTILWDREKIDANGTAYVVTVPVTCCRLPGKYPDFGTPYNESCPTDPSAENSFYDQKCYHKLEDYLRYYGVLMGCSCIVVVIFEALSIVILVAVVMEIKRNRKKVKHALIDDN